MIGFNRGVEYIIYFRDGTKKVIADTKKTDTRLLKSNFYKERKHIWFNVFRSFEREIVETGFDIELTDEEENEIDNLQNIKSIGWYDVCKMYTTLDITH